MNNRADQGTRPATPRRSSIRPVLLVFFALKSLQTHRAITGLLVCAIVAAVGFQVANEANLNGYRDALRREVTEVGPGAVRVASLDGNPIINVDAMAARIRRDPAVLAAVPVLTLPGTVGVAGRFRACGVTGVDPGTIRAPYHLLSGSPLREEDNDGVLVGTKYAEELNIAPGDRIHLRAFLLTKASLDLDDAVLRRDLTVRGVVAGAFGARNMVFVNRNFLAQQAGQENEATSISIYIDDPEAIGRVALWISQEFPAVYAKPWTQDAQYARSSLDAANAIASVSVTMVLAAVAIPVLALLYINVLHRRRDVGILTALGLDQIEIFFSFLLQAFAVACAAIPLGCVLGWVLLRYFDAHPIFQWEGFVLLPAREISCFTRPAGFVLAVTLVAGVFPAWLAARQDPALVIRGIE